jgi:hypothetical protein
MQQEHNAKRLPHTRHANVVTTRKVNKKALHTSKKLPNLGKLQEDKNLLLANPNDDANRVIMT